MAELLPLLSRDPDEIIAVRHDRQISCREFIAHCAALASALPENSLAVNLCEDRYLFMVAFAAAIWRGQANLLLPSRQTAAVAEALATIKDACILHDGEFAELDSAGIDVRPFAVPVEAGENPTGGPAPAIPADQLCAVVFTSGSTGESTRIEKRWKTLVDGTSINARHALGGIDVATGIVATVPPWHMYGLEYTVLLPLFNDVRIYTGNTLFPGDIRSALDRTPINRILVSTPLHLRAIARSGLSFPPVARVLCATAPLRQDLAQEIAGLLNADVCEFYGCSETGCLALRDPVTTTKWRFFDEFSINRSEDLVRIEAAHLPGPVTLVDTIELLDDGRFLLQGRGADIVKIGGKRGSIAELTSRLLTIDGVMDAVVFSPESNDDRETRLTALVVCPERDIKDIRRDFARLIDPVFVPRPMRKVEALPRNRIGKLRNSDLQRLVGADSSRHE